MAETDGVQVTSMCEYNGSARHGLFEEFYDFLSDRVKARISFRNDLRHGDYVKYYPDGAEYKTGSYFAGYLHGMQVYYYPSDQSNPMAWFVKEVREYYHGIPHGRFTQYDSRGNVTVVEEYFNGELVFTSECQKDHIRTIGLHQMSLPVPDD